MRLEGRRLCLHTGSSKQTPPPPPNCWHTSHSSCNLFHGIIVHIVSHNARGYSILCPFNKFKFYARGNDLLIDTTFDTP